MSEQDQRQTTGSYPIHGLVKDSAQEEKTEVLLRLLSGSLKEKPIAWLLQVANQNQATGQLLIGDAIHVTSVQLVSGRAIHAQSHTSTGIEAIYELFLVKDAKVKFEPYSQPTHSTIKQTFEEIFATGQNYLDSLNFLVKNEIFESSCLSRPKENPYGMDTLEILERGFKIDKTIQTRFLQNLSGIISIKALALKLSMPRSQAIITTANLLKLGLALTPSGQSIKDIDILDDSLRQKSEYDEDDDFIEPSPDPTLPNDTKAIPYISPTLEEKAPPFSDDHRIVLDLEETVPPDQITTSPTIATLNSNNAPKLVSLGIPTKLLRLDPESASRTIKRLLNPETGIMDADAFQYFLEFHFARAFRFSTSFSLVLFSIVTDSQNRGILPSKDLAKLLFEIDQVRRDVDITGQLGDKVYGIILPNIDSNRAKNLAERIVTSLDEQMTELTVWRPRLYFGIASIPNDARDLATLISSAQEALMEAGATDQSIVLYHKPTGD